MNDKRRRGIFASSAKLQRALVASDLRSQTAVAERIADNEGLDTSPRGLVNKVFRGEQVDARSIERVAKALKVEAWTLYANTDDKNTLRAQKDNMANQEVKVAKKYPLFWWVGALSSAIVVIAIIVWLMGEPVASGESTPINRQADTPTLPELEQLTVLVLPFGNETLERSLNKALEQHWLVLPNSGQASDQPLVLLDNGVAKRIITGRIKKQGRWNSLSLYVHQLGSSHLAWQGFYPGSASEQRLAYQLRAAVLDIVRGVAVKPASTEAQNKTLVGKHYLDLGRNEANVRRALTEFESALRSDSEHAVAHTGLCEALVSESIRTGDQARLQEAIPECEKALQLAPADLDAIRAQANLDRKRGRLIEAIQGFKQVLDVAPDNVDVLIRLTNTYLTQYQRQEDPQAAVKALATIEQANRIEPNFWKANHVLGSTHYILGDLDAAVVAMTQAVESDTNINTLNNLGTYQLCAGNFEVARDVYQRMKTMQPLSYLGEQQLAVAHYQLREFDQAVQGYKAALGLLKQSGGAEDYRVWGNYADGLRRIHSSNAAITAYGKALALAEDKRSSGDGNPGHAFARAYYHEMLRLLVPSNRDQTPVSLDELEATAETTAPIFVMFLAIIHAYRGDQEKAEHYAKIAGAGCPGIVLSPDVLSPQAFPDWMAQ